MQTVIQAKFLQLYTVLVRPHMEYACPVWAPYIAKDIGALEGVQKFACRMATHNWTSDYQELLSLINLPTLERRTELQLSHLFKIVHNLYFFTEGLVTIRECSHYNIRTTHSLTLYQPFAHTIISIPFYSIQSLSGIDLQMKLSWGDLLSLK